MNQHVSMKKKGFSLRLSIQLGIVLAVLLGSVGLTLGVLHQAHAAPALGSLPGVDPWGIAFDGRGYTWVAEPGCDETPVCAPGSTRLLLLAVACLWLPTFTYPTSQDFPVQSL
jgi:hypothetical protein